MTNTEAGAELELCPCPGGPGVDVLRPRLVPLGGPRAMTVRRTLPHRDRSFVGAWCFLDHYGPDDVARTGGMDVAPHPHTGLQTVSWLFDGQIEHRDSAGVHALVRPGEVNLMTGGAGIAHSEVSTPATRFLHGVQLWIVLPHEHRAAARDFQHWPVPSTVLADGVRARTFIGELAGRTSPLHTFTPLLGAELLLDRDVSWAVPVRPDFEHALLIDAGAARVAGQPLTAGELGILDSGPSAVVIEAAEPTRALLLGGVPFAEEVVMWWNFIGADHDEIAAARADWEQHADRFGEVAGYTGGTARLPAPALPGVRLRSRGRIRRDS